jgi:hypothetical protein
MGRLSFLRHRKGFLILFLGAFSVTIFGQRISPEVQAASTASIVLSPSSVASLSLTSGTVTFNINLVNSPAINQFYISLLYNHTVLQPSTLSFTGNVLGSNGMVLTECIDGRLVGGSLSGCQPWDVLGVTSFGMGIFGGVITPPATGLLFQITFNIAARGFSQIHFLHNILGNGSLTPVPVGTSDGYFTNADCPAGSGVLCKPTVPSFTFSPSAPAPGQTVTFNASVSVTPNRGATLRTFFWDFGDGSTPTANPQDPANPVIQHAYLIPGNFTAMLSITDSYGVTNSKAQMVSVAPMKDFYISIPTAPGTISAGDSVTVTVSLTSLFRFSGLVNLTVRINLLGPSRNPPAATLVQTSLLLSPEGTNSTSIVVSTKHSTTRALYGLEVDGTSGSLSHSVGVFLSVLHP